MGYRVWRDDELPAHRAYAEVIEERLKSAEAVVVLWSADSANRNGFVPKRTCARDAGTLVQVTIDGSVATAAVQSDSVRRSCGWDGDDESPGWRKLVASVRLLSSEGAGRKHWRACARAKVCVCVLPFVNMSGDAEQEYFSDGISEDITTDLSKVSALAVVARNTAFTFKGKSVDVCEIARKLGVTHVLEGSVRKAGGRVRINAQLIDGAPAIISGPSATTATLTDIFAIQDEISKAIVARSR